ncbi:hypothetical protein PCANC_00042 [Puccinia coronata f. sp. avenae]|uniref:Uncharacterized protein n=1 Tax=Puccinia coronata f. sp. avenae TaxID=200324 RepID=A0A2N5W8C1_9BASI|nr:hypothetical protein PCANC_00042 [Puccinia coronata f. sp. avenae]
MDSAGRYGFGEKKSTSDYVHAGILFWQAVALVPGSIAFWLSGWSAFYVVYLTPPQVNEKDVPGKKSSIHNPLVMNTICISVPVLITTYFMGFGIALFVKLKQTIETYELLELTLNQLSVQWKPNDPMTVENNTRLFSIITSLTEKADQLFHMAQAEIAGWAAVSVFIILFYITSAIASARLVKKSMLFASGKQWVDQRSESRDDLKEPINPSCSKDSNSAVLTSSTLGKPSRNCASNLQRLQRSYYYIYISCILMTVFLGLNFATNVTYLAKMRMVVIETQWQARLAHLETWTIALLSSSLFLKSLMMTMWS